MDKNIFGDHFYIRKEDYPVIFKLLVYAISDRENIAKQNLDPKKGILLTRYDLFLSKGMQTHITSNLSASELESIYGNHLRSRMREMFNLIAFDKDSKDKRS